MHNRASQELMSIANFASLALLFQTRWAMHLI
jgi:hypothetical protein